MAGVAEHRDTIDRVGQRVQEDVRRHNGRSTRQELRRRILRSTLNECAAIVTLGADLQQLAASLHEVAAGIHDLRRDQHVQAFLDRVGDPILHRQGAERHRTAAVAERAKAEKERRAGEQGPARPPPAL
jgi:hypothetical protein